ncbi:hypothetical protein KSD_29710 [Ktedonobacter sp. SOSP1-85]|nr:hypothetical protein KSD_29710 [Ktedonobacter sp. SOSP1-85]
MPMAVDGDGPHCSMLFLLEEIFGLGRMLGLGLGALPVVVLALGEQVLKLTERDALFFGEEAGPRPISMA